MLGWIRDYFADYALCRSFPLPGRRCDTITISRKFVHQRAELVYGLILSVRGMEVKRIVIVAIHSHHDPMTP